MAFEGLSDKLSNAFKKLKNCINFVIHPYNEIEVPSIISPFILTSGR